MAFWIERMACARAIPFFKKFAMPLRLKNNRSSVIRQGCANE
jgi:hypothetical protein